MTFKPTASQKGLTYLERCRDALEYYKLHKMKRSENVQNTKSDIMSQSLTDKH